MSIENASSILSEIIVEKKCKSEIRCRICHENTGMLVSVCNCSGSIGFVHDSCILDWMTKKILLSGEIQVPSCEICKERYAARLTVGPQKICYSLLSQKIRKLALKDTMSSLLQIVLLLASLITLLYFIYCSFSFDFLSSNCDVILQEIFLKVISQLFVIKTCAEHFCHKKHLL